MLDRVSIMGKASTDRTFSGKAVVPFECRTTCFEAEGTSKGIKASTSEVVKMDYKAVKIRSFAASKRTMLEKTHLLRVLPAVAPKQLVSAKRCCFDVPLL